MRLGAMLLPEVLGELRRVLLEEPRRSPAVEGRQGDLLRLRRAVRPGSGLCEVLLVVILPVVEDLLEVGGGADLGGDRALPLFGLLEDGLVRIPACFAQLPLLVVEVVQRAA
eukprot:CAMPEP_0198496312 /NCGR_PEP_ID=MMETSP1462-20131121/5754_1 /TAXON_ID=1333877 /ORGANISM="Brandtodinium nutriculum, Strain RCC3387" /LENGTH=111 /DNA_ID=CAMNT_0044225139 /DNA_START=171 /DNA_END=503 /DNA_ORIENTATION=+